LEGWLWWSLRLEMKRNFKKQIGRGSGGVEEEENNRKENKQERYDREALF